MANYKLAAAAEADVEAIYAYSEQAFGLNQTEKYMAGLGQLLEKLADIPRMGQNADDLRPGLFRFRYQSHMVFYTIERDHIAVRRILHARADFPSHL